MTGIEPAIDTSDDSAFLHQPIVYNKYSKLHKKPPGLFEAVQTGDESSKLISQPSLLSSETPSETTTTSSQIISTISEKPRKKSKKHKYPFNYNPRLIPTLEDDLWSIARGFRNGFIYGMKIRLPHAFVMTLLFNRKDIKTMSSIIFRKTKEHSIHLGQYVAFYKLCVVMFRRLLVKEKNNYPIIHLLAGALAGGIIWGKKTSVNHQINLYVFSRIVFGLARSGIERGYWKNYGNKAYTIFAATIWAIVMYLFEFEQHNLQRSLAASMEYLYHNEETVSNLTLMAIWDWIGFADLLKR